MTHPVDSHPVLSSALPNLAEIVLMSTIAAVTVPAFMREKVFDKTKAYTTERLFKAALDEKAVSAFGDAARHAVTENVAELERVAAGLGIPLEKLCYIVVKVNEATLGSLQKALASVALQG